MLFNSFKNERAYNLAKLAHEKIKFVKTDEFVKECSAEQIRTSKQTVSIWTKVWDSNDSEKHQATKRNTKVKPTIDDSKKQQENVTLQKLSISAINALKFIEWIKMNGIEYQDRFPELDQVQFFEKISKYIKEDN